MSNLFYQTDYWKNFPKNNLDIVAKDLHPSWDKDTQSYTEITTLHPEPLEIFKKNKFTKVLDFGIGMGRNSDYLNTLFEEVYGFDTEIMINNLKNYKNKNLPFLFTDWNELMKFNFDVVYECTVFQHMPPQEVLHRLLCISQKTKYLYSITRSYNDFFRMGNSGGINMFKLIDSTNLFDVAYCSIPIEDAKNEMSELHYHTLFKVK